MSWDGMLSKVIKVIDFIPTFLLEVKRQQNNKRFSHHLASLKKPFYLIYDALGDDLLTFNEANNYNA